MDEQYGPGGAIEPADVELDVRPMPKQERHPRIFAMFSELPVGGSLTLTSGHDPIPLRREFDVEQPGSFDWNHLSREPGAWQIKITKVASTPLPRVVINTGEVGDGPDAGGVLWKVQARTRDLDSNVIAIAAGEGIAAHRGPELDVIIHVLAGSGSLTTERDTVEMRPGDLLWLPRGSKRALTAGDDGLRYLTVHQRRQSLLLDTSALKA